MAVSRRVRRKTTKRKTSYKRTRRSRIGRRQYRRRSRAVKRVSKRNRRQKGGFLGFGSLKQGFSNLYDRVIGKKNDDQDKEYQSGLPDTRTYPLPGPSPEEMSQMSQMPAMQAPYAGQQFGQGMQYY